MSHASVSSLFKAGTQPASTDDLRGLATALAEAAEMVHGAVPQWQWRQEVEQMDGHATLEQWFDAARRVLGIQCLRVDARNDMEQDAYPQGVCLMLADGHWNARNEASSPAGIDAHATDTPKAASVAMRYRVVPSGDVESIGWPQIKRAVLGDKQAVNRIAWSTLLINVFALVIPLYMNAIYDRVLPAQANMSLWVLSIGVFICLGAEVLLRGDRTKAMARVAGYLQYTLEPQIIKRVCRVPFNRQSGWGRSATDALAGWSLFRSLYWTVAASSVADSAFTVLYLAIIAWIGGLIVLVPLMTIGATAYVVWRFDRALRRLQLSDAPNFSISPSVLMHSQASNVEANVAQGFLASSESLRLREQARYALQSSCTAKLGAISNLQTVLIVIAAFYLIGAHAMQPAGVFATILISGRVLQPFSSLMSVLPSLRQMTGALKKVDEAMTQATSPDAPNFDLTAHGTGWDIRGVSFGYDEQHQALKNVSLRIRPNERVALVGASGSGKSTLVKLLLGQLNPDEGSVLWGDAPLTRHRAEGLRQWIHYAWQGCDPIGTTPLNYLESEPGLSRERITLGINQAGVAPVVGRWPLGLLTPLAALSNVTQRTWEQFALARFIASQRKLYVLDGTSEALDQQALATLQSTIKQKQAEGAGLVIATDRLDLVRTVDRVIYLHDGRIEFDGLSADFLQSAGLAA